MNNVTLIGRLTRDPDIRTAGETQIANFTIAIDRGKDNQADYPSIKCFGKTAELVGKYCSKGKLIGVQGRIQTGSYEKNGQKVYTTDIIADRVEFLSKGESKPADDDPREGFSKVSEEDIPF